MSEDVDAMAKRRMSSFTDKSGIVQFEDMDGTGLISWNRRRESKSNEGKTVETYVDIKPCEMVERSYTSFPGKNNWVLSKPPKEPPVDYEEEVSNDAKSNEIKQSAVALLSGFAERTSMAGVAYIQTSIHYVAKLIWVVLLLAAVGAMIFHLVFLCQQYYSWPKQTKITLEFSNLPPPAISICNTNPIKKSELSRASQQLRDLILNTNPSKYKDQVLNIISSGDSEDGNSTEGMRGNGSTDNESVGFSTTGSTTTGRIGGSTGSVVGGTTTTSALGNGGGNGETGSVGGSTTASSTVDNGEGNGVTGSAGVDTTTSVNVGNGGGSGVTGSAGVDTTTSVNVGNGGGSGVTGSVGVSTTTSSSGGKGGKGGNGGRGSGSKGDGTRGSGDNSTGETKDSSNRRRRFEEDLAMLNLTNRNDDPIDIDDGDDPLAALMSTFRQLYMRESSKTRYRMGHSLKTMLIQCSVNGKRCGSRNFTYFSSENYGNCFTLQLNESVIDEPGVGSGIEMILFLDTPEYIHGITDGYGARVAIHDPGTIPHPAQEGFFVPAAFETSIGLKMVSVTRLGKPFGTCTDQDNFSRDYGVKYTFETCLWMCKARHAMKSCDCLNPRTFNNVMRTNISTNVKLCDTDKEKRCASKLAKQFRLKTLTCECPQACKENKYTKFISSHQYPTNDYVYMLLQGVCEENQERCVQLREQINDPRLLSLNFLKLAIYYEDLNYEHIKETPEIEDAQFLSDVGGAIGLWIGLSLLSLFEVLHLIVELVNLLLFRSSIVRPHKQTHPKM
ncbi:amiloride-sensitive sodium channel subunit alpha-like [Pecten maximus]|uniref:amiloride-sensitive sodium channel subunit alpha-like n=1 Tax=Pecten maximus TaxID=6579 RepID=UPI0014581BEF|nr:amiloride-sensitive sodium channel subunit alpha-like [Pecten maximus]